VSLKFSHSIRFSFWFLPVSLLKELFPKETRNLILFSWNGGIA